MPQYAKILSAQEHNGNICLWALVDLEFGTAPRTIMVYGTGHRINILGLQFIGTVQLGPLVFHVFESV